MKRHIIDYVKSLGMVVLISGFSAAVNAGDIEAKAEIRLCSNYNVVIGEAKLEEKESDEGIKVVEVEMKVEGLTPGKHAVHIHETGNCQPCDAAVGHFDPGSVGLTSPDGNHPFHMGDLININIKDDGKGKLKTVTTRVTLSNGPLSLFDMDDSAFIIHDNQDTYCPDVVDGIIGENAGCAGGSRFACGIIKRKY